MRNVQFDFINWFCCSYPRNYERRCHYQDELCRRFRDIITGFQVYTTVSVKFPSLNIQIVPAP